MYEYGLEKLDHVIDKCSRLTLLIKEETEDIEKLRSQYRKLVDEKGKLTTDLERLSLRRSNMESYAKEMDQKVEDLLKLVHIFENENIE